MRRSQADKLSCRDDLGFLPESREMPLIAGNQIVRARSIGALEKHIVIGVRRDFKSAGGRHGMAVILEEPDHEEVILDMMAAFEQPYHGIQFGIPDE